MDVAERWRWSTTFREATALAQPTIIVNGGRRGLQLELVPADLVRATQASVAPLIRD